VIVALTSAALVTLFIRFTSADRLNQLIVEQFRSTLKASLVEYYTANNDSWAHIAQEWPRIQTSGSQLVTAQPPLDANLQPRGIPNQQPEFTGQPGRGQRGLFALADSSGTILVGINPYFQIGEQLTHDQLAHGDAVQVNGKPVGYIVTAPYQPRLTPEEALYLKRTSQALIYASIAAVVVALVIGLLLAQTIIRPLRALTGAAQHITQGDLEQIVNVKSGDEIGQLANAFNQMSQEVAQVNRLRRQMTADIAHDLRTPLTVIAGYIESMQDGILQPTPERLAIINTEIQRLQNLVSDLRTLSLADAGELPLNPQPIDPQDLLERVAALFQNEAGQHGVNLSVAIEKDLPLIQVDEARMVQVLSNFVSNSLRYTPAGGEITLLAAPCGDTVEIAVRDNGSGIAPDNLSHIFERFYRADSSRHSDSGESGLGLAISKALVEAHGGRILAESEPGRGTIIRTQFKPCGEHLPASDTPSAQTTR
jgi:signal transduction histidine kinase